MTLDEAVVLLGSVIEGRSYQSKDGVEIWRLARCASLPHVPAGPFTRAGRLEEDRRSFVVRNVCADNFNRLCYRIEAVKPTRRNLTCILAQCDWAPQ
jgi:hypothetical protein